MTSKKRTNRDKAEAKKPRLRKETIKDLDAKRKAKDIKGGCQPSYAHIE